MASSPTTGNAEPKLAPIAIVGMSCRLSGGVDNADDFWTLLSRSRDGWTPLPAERFNKDAFYHPNPQKPGCFNQKGGYFLKRDISKFDAPFFQLTKAEAEAMGKLPFLLILLVSFLFVFWRAFASFCTLGSLPCLVSYTAKAGAGPAKARLYTKGRPKDCHPKTAFRLHSSKSPANHHQNADPQQRQLLECTYEALENAGFPKEYVSGKNMGVFVGASTSGYRLGTLRDVSDVPMFDSTGNHQSIQAGRLSHYFDLKGPCFSVDTACSSSIYALHSAVQSIRSGESDSAVVAASTLHIQPDDMISMSMLG